MAKILIADDEPGICEAFAEILTQEGHTPIIAATGREALDRIAAEQPAAVFMDVQMPHMSGLEALQVLQDRQPDLPVILMTARGSVQTAMDAMAGGAFDYLGKPLDLAQIRALLARALHRPSSTSSAPDIDAAEELVGRGPRMQQVFKLMGLVANNDLPVLITGEPGSGKELVARVLHRSGKRRDAPFFALDCSASEEPRLQEELFGHPAREAGESATAHTGLLEAAAGGTLYLEAIDQLPPALQTRLLRVLDDNAPLPDGSAARVTACARIVASSTAPLNPASAEQPFRQDLLQRLSVASLQLPPLRERTEDIAPLAHQFLRQSNRELNRDFKGIEADALDVLTGLRWPGNVAELALCIKRSALLAPGPSITVHDLVLDLNPPRAGLPGDPDPGLEQLVVHALRDLLAHREIRDAGEALPPFQQIVRRVEQQLVLEALRITDNNQVAASNLLGINRTTLRKKLAESQVDNLEGQ